jgi:hypothetical protein
MCSKRLTGRAFSACVAYPVRITDFTRFGVIGELFPDGIGVFAD